MRPLLAAGLVLGWAALIEGCGPGPQAAFGNRDLSWSQSRPGQASIPGLDAAEVDLGTWGDGAALAVWTEAGFTLGASGMGGRELQPGETREGVKYEGRIAGAGGRSWELDCYTRDGASGRVTIGDQSFDLARGGLFLVATGSESPRVRQLGMEKLGLKPRGAIAVHDLDVKRLQDLAASDPEIREFFSGAAGR